MPGDTRRFRRCWTAFVLLLTVAPYLLNRFTTPKGETYAWIVPPYPADSYAYRAWAQQAYDGSWLFTLKHTALPQKPFLFLPFFLVAGLIARVSRLDIGFVFLLLKSAGVLIFFRAFFAFADRLKLSSFQSAAAAVFAGVGAGFGAFAPLVFHPALPRPWAPLDSWLVDANTFWSLLWNPLFPFSLALILLSLRLALKSLEESDAGAARRCGLSLGALALIHPYPLAVLYPLIAVLCVVRRPRGGLASWLKIVGTSAPAAIYVAAVSYFQPLIRTHNALGTQDGFVLFAYLSGFGLPLILAATGWALEGAAFARKYWLLLLWLAISLALCRSPLWFRTKYVFGSHLAVCLLAGAAAETLFRRLPWGRRVNAALAAVLVATSSATLGLYLLDSVAEVSRNADGEYRLGAGFLAGVDYLRGHSSPADVVFSDPWTSAKICAYAGNTVVWGHWAQGVDSGERQEWVEAVFAPASGLSLDQRRRLFWNSGVEYVFLRGLWREGIATGVGPELLRGADKVFDNDAVSIYRRKP